MLQSWWLWLGLGGSATAIVVVLLTLKYAGLDKLLDIVSEAIRPAASAVGNMAGDVIRLSWENFRDGALLIATSTKAVFALLVVSAVVAGSMYFHTAKKVEKRTWVAAHRDYTLIRKPKPKPKPKASFDPRSTVHKSLGGL
jgi:hypothetical protein